MYGYNEMLKQYRSSTVFVVVILSPLLFKLMISLLSNIFLNIS